MVLLRDYAPASCDYLLVLGPVIRSVIESPPVPWIERHGVILIDGHFRAIHSLKHRDSHGSRQMRPLILLLEGSQIYQTSWMFIWFYQIQVVMSPASSIYSGLDTDKVETQTRKSHHKFPYELHPKYRKSVDRYATRLCKILISLQESR